ncbi:hypothetical protein K2173_010556 [Erythroxylum novogranatense]|uniref:Transcription factor CBF/NF-Y/archaeal histone domain-containing protein n=1 Tax=Erythroxylum novogranatense TaxID=1862640 RepID=A0AAV8TE82_9ROSI|nr:hypothetical protein K2173_010556 [Erythroxylum novogranatense]
MERGSGFYRYHKHAKYGSGLNMEQASRDSDDHETNVPNAANQPNNLPAATRRGDNANNNTNPTKEVREQDQYMPIANVIRIMRRILPPHAKISDDAKETVQECVSEYISFVTGEANDRCQREQRKTITAEDVLWAMGKLGFDDYVEPLSLFLSRYRESEADRSSILRDIFHHKRGTTATIDIGGGAAAGAMSTPLYMQTFPIVDQHQHHHHHHHGIDSPMLGGVYYGFAQGNAGEGNGSDGAGGPSSSQNGFSSYDPYAPFK